MKLTEVFSIVNKYMNDAQDAAIKACNKKYRANRNPAVAALYDGDPKVRSGAALLLAGLAENSRIITPNTLPVLREAIKKEKDKQVKVIMEAMYERISAAGK